MKLRNKDLTRYRKSLLEAQDGLCAMCNTSIDPTPCLDHDHATGHCRGVVCRSCNVLYGKLENARKRTGMSEERFGEFLRNVHELYKQAHEDKPIHPRHLSQDEKMLKKYKKLLKRSKKDATKGKYKLLIKELKGKIEKSTIWYQIFD